MADMHYEDNPLEGVVIDPDRLVQYLRLGDGPYTYQLMYEDGTQKPTGVIWIARDGSRSGYRGQNITKWMTYWRQALDRGFTPRDIYDYAAQMANGNVNWGAGPPEQADTSEEFMSLIPEA
jgi:hypothetical protein